MSDQPSHSDAGLSTRVVEAEKWLTTADDGGFSVLERLKAHMAGNRKPRSLVDRKTLARLVECADLLLQVERARQQLENDIREISHGEGLRGMVQRIDEAEERAEIAEAAQQEAERQRSDLMSTPEQAEQALIDAAGLCSSEARRWERSDPRTSEHWASVTRLLRSRWLVVSILREHKESAEAALTALQQKGDARGG
jgi:hypothetical protein